PVFLRGALQVEHELLEFLRHGVESIRQFADLGAALQVDALGKISTSDGAARFRQDFQRVGNAPRRVNTQAHADQYGQQSQEPSGALHFVDAAIGFVSRFLHNDRPIQSSNRAVGPEHGGPCAVVESEFLGRCELRLVAFFDKGTDNFQVLHVLAGGKFRGGGGHQTTLGIDHVRNEATATDFRQAANEEFQIDYRSNHPQEAAPIHNWSTDENNCSGSLAAADYQRLAVIHAAFAGRIVRPLEFALQECVGSDSSR